MRFEDGIARSSRRLVTATVCWEVRACCQLHLRHAGRLHQVSDHIYRTGQIRSDIHTRPPSGSPIQAQARINRSVDVEGHHRPDTGSNPQLPPKGIGMNDQSRQHAIHRIKARRHFAIHLLFYVALATYFVAEWARSGASGFWPVWPLLGGVIGLAAHASHLFDWQLPIAEEKIQREINRRA